ncbi:ABC transporter ATP-binding protein [Phyllobacterium sp. LjRoot231]|uniref:ABC transporter ATP-binding protein n=1 Tax=Phyllobacterium sp. LjRoot231 TaxID=3342289 RepID=UPI003ED139AF
MNDISSHSSAAPRLTPSARTLTPRDHPCATEPLLELRSFTVAFPNNDRNSTRAVHGVDLSIAPGEALGIVGESGCGKSVTWLAALRLLGKRVTTTGKVLLAGRELSRMSEREIAAVRGGRIGLIFQDPTSSLNPVHRIGRQIGEALYLHRGLSGAAAQAEALRLLDRVGIADAPRRLKQYPHELSGGTNQRVMIAIALAGEPDVLIADEPTTALDATIQAQILDLIRDIRRDTGMGLVLISHDLGVVADLCDRVAVMYAGRVVETAATDTLLHHPQHPYTRGLLAALPTLYGPRVRLTPIPGTVPPPDTMPPGCAFAPRCRSATAVCQASVPTLVTVGTDHQAACVQLPEPLTEPSGHKQRKHEEVPA